MELLVNFGAGIQQNAGHGGDLRTSGMFLYTDARITEGSELEIVLMLPAELMQGANRWVCCRSSVLRVEGGGEKGNSGISAKVQSINILPEIPG